MGLFDLDLSTLSYAKIPYSCTLTILAYDDKYFRNIQENKTILLYIFYEKYAVKLS